MSVKVIKQPRENTQNIIRRFTKAIKKSGVLIEARKFQFKAPRKNKRAQKISALRRIVMSKKYKDEIAKYKNPRRH